MDASEQFAFPTPQPQDTAEVREAIEKAGILWSEDPKESLKWLRQAAELASDAEDDLRSVQLARVAADLRNLANIAPSIPPPTTLPPLSIPMPGAPVVGEAVGGEVKGAAEPVQSDPVIAVNALSEQPVDAAAVTATVPESNGSTVAASAPTDAEAPASEGAPSEQATPHAPEVAAAEQAAVSPAAEAPFAFPQVSFSKDPAQTVPATPAASAAALAMATGPASYQSVPAPASVAPGASATAAVSAPVPGAGPVPSSNGSIAHALTSKRQAPAFGGPSAGFSGAGVGGGLAGVSGPRPEQPTLVGRPFSGPRGLNDETPAATPAAIQADSVAPGSTNRFIQHRAVEVAVSIAPNASGHFDVRPLNEGEAVEPGFRRALLVALGAEDRLFPGRG